MAGVGQILPFALPVGVAQWGVDTGHPRTSALDQFHEQAQFPCGADLN